MNNFLTQNDCENGMKYVEVFKKWYVSFIRRETSAIHIDGLAQECGNFSPFVTKLLQSFYMFKC